MSEHTCGECRWWKNGPILDPADEASYYAPAGSCLLPLDFVSTSLTETCPAFDNGEYDKAVDALIVIANNARVGILWGTPLEDGLNRAIAAVEKARAERGRI
jgi:hypothetical protein